MKRVFCYYDGFPQELRDMSIEELDAAIAEEEEKNKEFQKKIDELNKK